MRPGIASAILNISRSQVVDLDRYSGTYGIRINAAGEKLEHYVKDAIAGSFGLVGVERLEAFRRNFSYEGNQNNPPDIICRSGDAFEVKKVEGDASVLALNSSFPKDRLHRDDPRITQDCRESDGGTWNEKDLFYAVGRVMRGGNGSARVSKLMFVDGRCYAAKREVYNRLEQRLGGRIKKVISAQWEAGETTELGRVKRVDPLGITELRIRGMWQIVSPFKVFEEVITFRNEASFKAAAILRAVKYDSLSPQDKEIIESSGVGIRRLTIRNPNNPATGIEAVSMECEW